MSGGNLEYFCFKFDDIIRLIAEHESTKASTLRQDFIEHLRLVSQALYDIEWVDSGDYNDGDENKAILAVLDHTVRVTEAKCILNWQDAIEYVLTNNLPYLHPKVTIEKVNGSKNICLATTAKSEYFNREQALIALDKLEF